MSTATAAPVTPAVKVGDYFECSWGYDQTQVDFYRVIEVTPSGKSVRVQEWSKSLTPDSGSVHDYGTPGEGPVQVRVAKPGMEDQARSGDYWERQEASMLVDAPITLRRLKTGWSRPAFTVNSYSTATLWDGKPVYQTGAHYGH